MNNKRIVYLISGPLGVGKSSLCKMIQRKLDYLYIDGDSIFVPLEMQNVSWEKRLKISWDWIIDETRKAIREKKNVVIDFVFKDELPWFIQQISELNVEMRYAVLVANEDEIKKRLEIRDGGLQYFNRSKLLLNQLKNDPRNQPYLIDSSKMNTSEVFNIVTNDRRFKVK